MDTQVVFFSRELFYISLDSRFQRSLTAVFSRVKTVFSGASIWMLAAGEILSADNPKSLPQDLLMSTEEKKPQKVLVVDDDADVLAAICDSLDIYNIAYLSTQRGKEAIQLYQANQQEIFLVLLDLKMPGMDGEAVYKALSEINPNVIVLISSGYHESDVMSRFIGTGQVDFLPKPFNIKQLIQAINKYLLN